MLYRTVICTFTLALTLGSACLGQTQDRNDFEAKLRHLNAKLENIGATQERLIIENAKLRRDNDELRDLVDNRQTAHSELEVSLNALADAALDSEGAAVVSNANPITVSGAFRFRLGFTANRDFGSSNQGNDSSDDNGTYIDGRINVAFDFALARNVTGRFEMISAGLFENSAANHNTGTLDEVDLYQGYIAIDGIFGRDELGLKIGRQEIVLGSELWFGNNSFYGGETFDAVLAWWNQDEFFLGLVWAKMDIRSTYNAAGHPYVPFQVGNGYDDNDAFAAYFTLKTIENHVLDLYYFFWNDNGPGGTFGTLGNLFPADTFAHVFGIRLAGDLPNVAAGLDYSLEFAYETGDIDSLGIDMEGFIFEAGVGITFNANNLLRVAAGFIFAEGPDSGDSGFVPLFVDRHEQVNWDDHTARRARWGLMDIIPLTNVIAGQIGLTFRPAEDWIFGATFLGAWRDQSVLTTDGDTEDGIGWEIDVFADYRYSAETTISVGVGVFIPNEGAPLQNSALSAGNNEDDATFLMYLQALTTF